MARTTLYQADTRLVIERMGILCDFMQPLTNGKMHYPVIDYKPILLVCMVLGLSARLPIAAAAEQSDHMWGLCHTASQPEPSPGDGAPAALSPTYLNSDYGEGKLDEISDTTHLLSMFL